MTLTATSAAILWVCAAIAVAVFAVMIYSFAAFRPAPDAVPAAFRRSRTAEVLWAIVPILIIAGTAAHAARACFS